MQRMGAIRRARRRWTRGPGLHETRVVFALALFGVGLTHASRADAAAEASSRGAAEAPSVTSSEASKENGIYADLGLGVIGLGYERVLGEKLALNLSAHYYRPWYVSDHVFGFGGELRAFVFLTEPAPNGPYFSSSFRLDHVQAKLAGGETPAGVAWGVRATVGYGVAIGSAVNLRLGLGVQSHAANLSAASEDQDFAGAYPTVDALIGVRF